MSRRSGRCRPFWESVGSHVERRVSPNHKIHKPLPPGSDPKPQPGVATASQSPAYHSLATLGRRHLVCYLLYRSLASCQIREVALGTAGASPCLSWGISLGVPSFPKLGGSRYRDDHDGGGRGLIGTAHLSVLLADVPHELTGHGLLALVYQARHARPRYGPGFHHSGGRLAISSRSWISRARRVVSGSAALSIIAQILDQTMADSISHGVGPNRDSCGPHTRWPCTHSPPASDWEGSRDSSVQP